MASLCCELHLPSKSSSAHHPNNGYSGRLRSLVWLALPRVHGAARGRFASRTAAARCLSSTVRSRNSLCDTLVSDKATRGARVSQSAGLYNVVNMYILAPDVKFLFGKAQLYFTF